MVAHASTLLLSVFAFGARAFFFLGSSAPSADSVVSADVLRFLFCAVVAGFGVAVSFLQEMYVSAIARGILRSRCQGPTVVTSALGAVVSLLLARKGERR